jgi:2',3'-cyclic-nucleotide 2'-phosphodiesterase/3'-nucleotidase
VVNQAQTAYVQDYVKANLPQYAALPVLSMASPFKAGAAGVADYTDVKPGGGAQQCGRPVSVPECAARGEDGRRGSRPGWKSRPSASTASTRPAARRRSWSTPRPGFNFDMLTSADVATRSM